MEAFLNRAEISNRGVQSVFPCFLMYKPFLNPQYKSNIIVISLLVLHKLVQINENMRLLLLWETVYFAQSDIHKGDGVLCNENV
ncbi:hypothetical protein CHI10_13245 [Bacillus sp. 7894-2]|nr:hypothetical protein CHI10_13245 [Bacillus sp. 7894-2]